MRNQQILKLFLVLIISITYIMSFSHFGALAYGSIMSEHDEFAEGTSIGSISVAGQTPNTALQLIDEQLTKWLNETEITLKYMENSTRLDLSYFTFDLEDTISQAKNGQPNFAKVELEPIDEILYSLSPSLTENDFHWDELIAEIIRSAASVEIGSYEIRLESYLKDASKSEPHTIAEYKLQAEYVEAELELFVGKSIEIEPTSQFSLLEFVDDEIGAVSPLTLSKIATGIYNVFLPTNFDFIERHISNELPEYAELGFEAKADQDLKLDLVFSNPNEFSYLLEFEKKNDDIFISLKGPELLNKYVILPEDKETFKPKIIRQFNPNLGPTEIKVKVEGKEGQLIKVFREHRDEKGAVLKKELVAEDFYPPIHRVEVQGLIIKEGDSTIIPETDTTAGNNGEDSSNSTDDEESSTENPTENSDQSNSTNEDDLWGNENELPK
ncbi:VanW family protein [Robertmurraya kyonggiensis]|uniref:VanW family protein n=1 Tax=Robertmurraya kyonggiensis TaxID=1037680 RepID=UPI00130EFE6F|nr:VanW family protein [Robertmurraya kyonggiensis]